MLLQVRHLDLILLVEHGHDGRLVHEVLEHRAREADRAARDDVEVDVAVERLVAAVHLEDVDAARLVGQVDGHAAVEAAGAEQRRVEDVGAVGGGEHDDAAVAVEAVHLGEDLVQRLIALVVDLAMRNEKTALESLTEKGGSIAGAGRIAADAVVKAVKERVEEGRVWAVVAMAGWAAKMGSAARRGHVGQGRSTTSLDEA